MIDFQAISEMNVEQFTNYIESIDLNTLSESDKNLLHMANGFLLHKELIKLKLTEEQISKIFHSAMLTNKMQVLEKLLN